MKKLLVMVGGAGLIIALALGCGDDDSSVSPVDNIAPAAITDLEIIGLVDTTALLTWTSPGNDGDEGTATSYDIRYATDVGVLTEWTDANQVPDLPAPKVAGSTELIEISGLSIDSMYYFRIKTSDDNDNVSLPSNIVQKTVSSYPVVQIISPLGGSLIGEIVEIEAIATDDKGVVKVEFFADNNFIGVDLAPPYTMEWDAHWHPHGAGHVIYAYGTDADNHISSSNAVYCYTDTTLFMPQKPNIVAVSGVTDSSATITWDKNDDLDFEMYFIFYDTTDAIDHLWSPRAPIIEDQADTSCTITSLLDTAAYYFQVATIDIFGNISFSNIDSCTTNNGVPSPVQLNYPTSFSDSVIITWVQSPIKDFQSYTLYRSLDELVITDDLLLATIQNQDSIVFVDNSIDTGQIYYYAILLEDVGGLSSFSNVVETQANLGMYSLEFEGDDYCVIPHFSELDFTTSFTLEAWVYPKSTGGYLRIIDKTESQCCLQYSLLLHERLVGADLGVQTVNGYERVNGNQTIPTNQWSHIAVTYSSGRVCFYVNGFLNRCEDTDLTSLNAFPTDLNIGRRLMYDEFYFVGLIDEIRMWNIARTEAEIFGSYSHPLLGIETGLVGYWRFDDGTGDVAAAVNGNDCQLGSEVGVDENDPAWVENGAPLSK